MASYQPHEHLIQTLKLVESILTKPHRPVVLECDYCHRVDASVRLRGWSRFEAYCCDYCEDAARERALNSVDK